MVLIHFYASSLQRVSSFYLNATEFDLRMFFYFEFFYVAESLKAEKKKQKKNWKWFIGIFRFPLKTTNANNEKNKKQWKRLSKLLSFSLFSKFSWFSCLIISSIIAIFLVVNYIIQKQHYSHKSRQENWMNISITLETRDLLVVVVVVAVVVYSFCFSNQTFSQFARCFFLYS